MSESQITRSALSWLRETDTLDVSTLKRAYWEGKRFEIVPESYGTVRVINHCHKDPHDHAHEVGVNQHGIVHHCTCAQFKYRDKMCKHAVAVAMEIDRGSLDLADVGCKEDVIARVTPQEA